MRLLVVLLLAALAGTAHGQVGAADATPVSSTPDSATRRAILGARTAIWKAWFANDTAQLRRLLPEAVAAGVGAGRDQRWADREQTTHEAQQFVAAGGKLIGIAFPRTEIQVAGDVAVVFSTYELRTSVRGTIHTTHGRSSEVFVRSNGRWVNPFWHLGA
jgi:hypothetical protein